MSSIIRRNGIKKVIVSILAAGDDEINGIIEICKELNVECKRMKPIIDNYK